ncbi:MAG TPA: host attachment protein [Aliiroseovarius sp.]|nr:host attachment protein [Aliiroseovarius sp.]
MKRMQKGAYALIADGARALLVENIGTALAPELAVIRREEQENPPSGAQGTDKPGRMPDPGQGQRSAVENTDWHQLAEDRFAAGIAEMLGKLAQKGAFREIILVAPPKTLAELREKMPGAVRDRVVAEINKDLTGMPLDKIGVRIKEILDEMSG